MLISQPKEPPPLAPSHKALVPMLHLCSMVLLAPVRAREKNNSSSSLRLCKDAGKSCCHNGNILFGTLVASFTTCFCMQVVMHTAPKTRWNNEAIMRSELLEKTFCHMMTRYRSFLLVMNTNHKQVGAMKVNKRREERSKQNRGVDLVKVSKQLLPKALAKPGHTGPSRSCSKSQTRPRSGSSRDTFAELRRGSDSIRQKTKSATCCCQALLRLRLR